MLLNIPERAGVVDPLPCRRENKEHHGGEEPGAEGQVGQHLIHVVAGLGEEAALHGGVAERHRQDSGTQWPRTHSARSRATVSSACEGS